MPVKSIPDGYHSVTPYLTVGDAAAAIEFYKKALGATEVLRLEAPDGRLAHAELQIGSSRIMMSGEWPERDALGPLSRGGTTVGFMIYVDDCDAAFERAVDSGAKIERPVADQFYGDRAGTVKDPFGHKWTLATHKEDLTQDEVIRRMNSAMG